MKHSERVPPLEALEAVLAAAAAGSFSAAAARLDITHGAVSRRVAAIEHWAGITLFTRHGRGVRLTLEGQRLAARIEVAVAMIEDGRAIGRREPELDTVRVGVVQSFARLWLLPNLRALEGAPPDLRIEPEIDHRHMMLSDARIAIRLGRGDWTGVACEPLFPETLYPIACREIAEELGPAPAVERLLDYPLLHDASQEGWQHWLSSQGETYERRARDRLFDGYDLALLAAASGLGIALARYPYGREFMKRQDLVACHGVSVASPQKFHVVTPRGRRHEAVERLVRRLLACATEGAEIG